MYYTGIQITAETEEKMQLVLESISKFLKEDNNIYDFEYEEMGEYE